MKSPKRRKTLGFTLMEALAATAIASISVAGVYTGLAWGFAVVQSNRTNLRATQILVKRAEAIRLCSFDQVTNTNYNPATFTEYFDSRDQSTGGGGTLYNGTFAASVPPSGSVPDSYCTNMLLVTINVSWMTGNTPHSCSLQTYVARRGIEDYISSGR